jgi:hypothetical protein
VEDAADAILFGLEAILQERSNPAGGGTPPADPR